MSAIGRASVLFVVAFFAVPASAEDYWGFCGPSAPEPKVFAKEWLEKLQRLDSALPSLSPREDEWVRQELNTTNMTRITAVMNSREYASKEAKHDAQVLIAYLKAIAIDDAALQYKAWTAAVTTLLEYDIARDLAILIVGKTLDVADVPFEWTYLWNDQSFVSRESSIRAGRMSLAREISGCMIPRSLRIKN